jgi:hypothetical protein
MDPAMQPINGISLERYADLGAAIADFMNDKQKVAEVLAKEGVQQADWDAAVAGWTARMQDMSLMGRVAMAYMPMYQAALARRKGGQAQASYEDYVAVSAAIKVYGFEAACQACGVSQSDWTEIAGHWNQTMAREMMKYAGNHQYISQEEQRLRSGGQPKRITVTRAQGAAPQPQHANPMAAAMGVAPGTYVPPNANVVDMAMQNQVMQQAQVAQQQVMANPLGFGLQQGFAALTGGVAAGANVIVTWSDGTQYRARVMQVTPQQVMVSFENGSQHWVPTHAVRPA